MFILSPSSLLFFFNDPATTQIYTLSLHDALPILPFRTAKPPNRLARRFRRPYGKKRDSLRATRSKVSMRSEEHTSELQSHSDLVCRLLLEKKKKTKEEHKRISTGTRSTS